MLKMFFNYSKVLKNSKLFDETWYQQTYLKGKNINPIKHYLSKGWRLGYNPSLLFSTNQYLSDYEDIEKANINPLLHYELYGKKEGRIYHHNNDPEIDNILLFTDVPPCTNYSGGIFLNQLSRIILDNGHNFFGFFFKNKNATPAYDQYVKQNSKFYVSDFEEAEYDNPVNMKIAKQCIGFIKKYGVTKIWCYVQNVIILQILDYVMERVDIPVVVQIMDPLEWHIYDRKFDKIRKVKILQMLDKAINNSEACITASENMKDIYKQKYSVNCEYLTIYIKDKDNSNIVKPLNDQFVICMVGQVYCHEELKSLFQALESMNWQYRGKQIIFKYYGNWNEHYSKLVDLYSFSENNIILNGYVEQSELIKLLDECDLLYCPYFFSQKDALKLVCEQSFPSKLITYFTTSTPVVVHAPKYASPAVFTKKHNCAYTIDSIDVVDVKDQLKRILADGAKNEMVLNANQIVKSNFTREMIEKKFLDILNLKPVKKERKNSLNILQVNNVDLAGSRFNGYDLIEYAKNNSSNTIDQIVTRKFSASKNVYQYFTNDKVFELENRYRYFEELMMSIHSQFSVVGYPLENSEIYQKADVVHYHLIHNTKLPLPQMAKLFSQVPSVITVHDIWNLTGRCAYPLGCNEWKTGCRKCDDLDTLFPFKQDNCFSLWQQKLKAFADADIDVIVATDYINDNFVQQSPILNHLKNVHILPFGINLKDFNDHGNKQVWRKIWSIPENDIVIFFRSQKAMKGIEYITKALELLSEHVDTKNITLITCSEVGKLDKFKGIYNIVELGDEGKSGIIGAFNACDFFLMPTKSETFGLMGIECMACARPIIVFNNMTLPSLTFAPDCGVLVEDRNSQRLMKAIKYLIDNPAERERRGKLGRELAEKHYDVNVYNRRILEIYEKAYERQKYKLADRDFVSAPNEDIDYTNKNVQLLMHAIRQNANSNLLFGNENVNLKFIDDHLIPIGYADAEVEKFINKFNYEVYRHYKSMAYVEENKYINCCKEEEFKQKPYEFIKKYARPVYRRIKHYYSCVRSKL